MEEQPKCFKKSLLQATNPWFSIVFHSRTHPLLSLMFFLSSLFCFLSSNSLKFSPNSRMAKDPLLSLLLLPLNHSHSLSQDQNPSHTPPAAPLCHPPSPTSLITDFACHNGLGEVWVTGQRRQHLMLSADPGEEACASSKGRAPYRRGAARLFGLTCFNFGPDRAQAGPDGPERALGLF